MPLETGVWHFRDGHSASLCAILSLMGGETCWGLFGLGFFRLLLPSPTPWVHFHGTPSPGNWPSVGHGDLTQLLLYSLGTIWNFGGYSCLCAVFSLLCTALNALCASGESCVRFQVGNRRGNCSIVGEGQNKGEGLVIASSLWWLFAAQHFPACRVLC